MKTAADYPYEWLRSFVAGRGWLCGDDETYILSAEQRARLMKRESFSLSHEREEYLLGFIDGWTRAKQ